MSEKDQGLDGKFLPGHKLAKGNPLNRRAQALRAKVIQYMTTGKLVELIDMLFEEAIKEKNIEAAKELLTRTLGKPKDTVDFNLGGGVVVASMAVEKLSRLSIPERENLLAMLERLESDDTADEGSGSGEPATRQP